ATDSALLARARTLITHADPAVRSVAADLLARHPSSDDVDLLVAAYMRADDDPFNDARLSAVSALGAIAAASPTGRLRVATKFIPVVAAPARTNEDIVRRLAADRLLYTRDVWVSATRITTS